LTDEQVQRAIDHFFKAAGIKRVVSIDDMYGELPQLDEFVSLAGSLEAEVSSAVIGPDSGVNFTVDPEVRDAQLRRYWQSLDSKAGTALIDELRSKVSTKDDTDLVAKQKFAGLFVNQEFVGLSLKQWEEQKNAILSDNRPSLLLVDEDFSKEGRARDAGRPIIRELLRDTNPEQVMCGLVSHNYSPTNIHDDREQLCEEEHFDRSRFVLIPKTLADDDLAGFASLIKLAVVAKPLDTLRSKVTDILFDSLVAAGDSLKKLNIYDMEQIVFQSSLKEGVWEPETLVRVFNLYIRFEARRKLFGDAEIHSLASGIRRVSEIKTDSPMQPAHKIWPIQNLESFDDTEILNTIHLPIAVGDIFQRANRYYILISPPCDLAVRRSGQREGGIREAIIAEIVNEERKNGSCALKFFKPDRRVFVDFKRTHSVKLAAIDLCAFNADGSAKMTMDEATPGEMVPSWEKRHGILQIELGKMIEVYERIGPSAQQRDDIIRAVFRCSNEGVFLPSYDSESKVLRYDFKRIARLREPRSLLLLQKYADFLTREALEHDLETLSDDGAEVSTITQAPESNDRTV
jgi:hypothetical protein